MPSLCRGGMPMQASEGDQPLMARSEMPQHHEAVSFSLAKDRLLRAGAPALMGKGSRNNPCLFPTWASPRPRAMEAQAWPKHAGHRLFAGRLPSWQCTLNMSSCVGEPDLASKHTLFTIEARKPKPWSCHQRRGANSPSHHRSGGEVPLCRGHSPQRRKMIPKVRLLQETSWPFFPPRPRLDLWRMSLKAVHCTLGRSSSWDHCRA